MAIGSITRQLHRHFCTTAVQQISRCKFANVLELNASIIFYGKSLSVYSLGGRFTYSWLVFKESMGGLCSFTASLYVDADD